MPWHKNQPYLISIHALREEGDVALAGVLMGIVLISIHALREEGDHWTLEQTQDVAISIHALREEGDHSALCPCRQGDLFLSTPSARRATRHRSRPCLIKIISIHALREEGDQSAFSISSVIHRFLSTPSARRAT